MITKATCGQTLLCSYALTSLSNAINNHNLHINYMVTFGDTSGKTKLGTALPPKPSWGLKILSQN